MNLYYEYLEEIKERKIQNLDPKAIDSAELLNEGEVPKLIWPIENNPKILAITNTGRVALLKWEFAGHQPGLLEKFLPSGLEGDKVVSLLCLPDN